MRQRNGEERNTGDRRTTKRRARWTSLGAVAVTFALVAAACGGDDDGGPGGGEASGTITFANWATAEDTTRAGVQEVEESFAQQHEGVQVDNDSISFSEIANQLVLRTRSGNPPDIAQIAGNDTFVLAQTGALEPLDSYLSEETRARVDEALLRPLTQDGELVAFPWTVSPLGFWYNKPIMSSAGLDPEAPPTTIEELTEALQAVQENEPDVIPLGIDTTNRPFALSTLWPWMKTFGAEPFGADGANADTTEMREFLTWIRELAQNGYIEMNRKIGDFRPLGAQDKVAFVWDQDVFQGVVQDTNGSSDEEFYDTWGVSTLPTGPTGEAYSADMGHQLVMFADSDNKQISWELIEHLAADSEAVENYTLGPATSLPPLSDPSGQIAEELDNPVTTSFTGDIIPTFTLPPYGSDFAEASTPVMAGIQQAATSDQPIEAIASGMQQRLSSTVG